mgnify:CR=1 FL=1
MVPRWEQGRADVEQEEWAQRRLGMVALARLGTRLHAVDNTQLVVGVHLLLARRER